MRGSPNTSIVLTVRRGVDASAKIFDVKLTRAVIKTQVVRSHREGEFAYVRITSFNEHTTQDMTAAIDKLKTEMGPALKGYIIDLRENPGGLLDQAIRSEEHTSELQSLMRNSYAVFCLTKKTHDTR